MAPPQGAVQEVQHPRSLSSVCVHRGSSTICPIHHLLIPPPVLLSSSLVGVPAPETNRGSHSVFKSMHFERPAQQESHMDQSIPPVDAPVLTPAVTTASKEVETLPEVDTTESRLAHEVSSPPESGTVKDDEVQSTQVGKICIESTCNAIHVIWIHLLSDEVLLT